MSTSTEPSSLPPSSSSPPRFACVIGNRKYSSWSLRGWLAVRLAAGKGHFDEIFCPIAGELAAPDVRAQYKESLMEHSPTGKVPALVDRQLGVTIQESLAIALHMADCFPHLHLLPEDPAARALCLGAAVEMHAGFSALRTHMPTHTLRRAPKYGATAFQRSDVQADVKRLETLWTGLLTKYGTQSGKTFLFGSTPTIADIMYAPVALRFASYDDSSFSHLSSTSRRYVETLLEWDGVREWIDASKQEGTHLIIPTYEQVVQHEE